MPVAQPAVSEKRIAEVRRELELAAKGRRVSRVTFGAIAAVLLFGAMAIGAFQIPGDAAVVSQWHRPGMPFAAVITVGQLAALVVAGVGVVALRTAAAAPMDDAYTVAWRRRVRRVRIPMLVLGLVVAVGALIAVGISAVHLLGVLLGMALLVQCALVLTAVSKVHNTRIMRVFPKVFGFTRAKSRNSATPSS